MYSILCSWFCCPLVLILSKIPFLLSVIHDRGVEDEKHRHLITHWCVGEGSPVMVTKAELGVMKLRTEKSAEGTLHNCHVRLGKTCGSREYNSSEVSHVQKPEARACVHKTGRLET